MIKVILLIDCASEHDRRLLRGMMRYSKENGPWLFHRFSPDPRNGGDNEELVVKLARTWEADAIIGRWSESKLHLLEGLDIPVVLQNNRSRSDVFSNLTGDYPGTGKMAADYFRGKLYTEYAFYGISDIVWSEERCKGFQDEVLENRCSFHSYMEVQGQGDRDDLIRWLQGLPKPVALFCCDDAHAQHVTEICKICGIRVPEDISILGVDDDDLLCNISDPPISSIEMDVEQGGYMTCKMLHQQILSHSTAPFNVWITPVGIRERASTSFLDVKDPHAERLIAYIEENFGRDLTMDEILATVPLSRRSAEQHFKNATGITIYQYLLRTRVEHLAYLLVTSDRSCPELAYEAGFRDLSNVSRTFRKFKGCTPVEYRKQNCVI